MTDDKLPDVSISNYGSVASHDDKSFTSHGKRWTCQKFEAALDELLTELENIENERMSFYDLANILLCGFTFAVQFMVWKWNQNDEGTYNFKTGNAFLTCSVILCIALYSKTKKDGGLYTFPKSQMAQVFFTRVTLGLANVLQMIGLLYTTPAVAASLWFSKILMVALALFCFKGVTPDRLLGSILLGVILGVMLFVVRQEQNAGPNDLIGVATILVSMMLYGFSIVLTNHVLSDKSFDDISKYDRYFYLFLFQVPVYAATIGIDMFFGKSIAFTDFIPGWGYDWKAWCLIAFLVIQYFVGTVVQGLGTQVYVVTAYTGNFATLILSGALSGFAGFDVTSFIISAILFVNAITYKLAAHEEELLLQKTDYLQRFRKLAYMQKKCPIGLARSARQSKDFNHILLLGLADLRSNQEDDFQNSMIVGQGMDSDKLVELHSLASWNATINAEQRLPKVI